METNKIYNLVMEEDECDFLCFDTEEPNEEAVPIWEEIEKNESELKSIRRKITAYFEVDCDTSKMTESDKAALSELHESESDLLNEEIELYKKLHACVGNIFIVEYQCNLEKLINEKQKLYDFRTGKKD